MKMIAYAPYVAVAFWGTMIFLGLRAAFVQEKGPLVAPLRDIKKKMGVLIWGAIAILYIIVLILVRQDSETIRRMESPVGLFTSAAFIPIILGNALLAARLFIADARMDPQSDEISGGDADPTTKGAGSCQ